MTGPGDSTGTPATTSPTTSAEAGSARAEDAALQDALAAEHAAVWGYGTVGAALTPGTRGEVVAAQEAHRDLRDRVGALLLDRGAEPVAARPAYALPFPLLSDVDACRLAAVLEEGTTAAWVWVLDQAAQRTTRELAVVEASAAEVRAVTWRARAGLSPVTAATPGLPA